MLVALLIALVMAPGPGQSRAAQDAVRAICNTVTDDPATREELTRRLDSFGESGRQALLAAATPGGSHDWERGCAWQQLTRLKDPRVLPLIRTGLTDPAETPENRRLAIAVLGQWGDKDSVAPLVALLQSTDALESGDAALALGLIDADEARMGLRRALDAPREYPWDIVQAVGRQRDASAVPRLRELSAQLDRDRAFQVTITDALARIGTPDALELLETIVARMSPSEIRHGAVIFALAELRATLAQTKDPGLRGRIQRTIDTLTPLIGR